MHRSSTSNNSGRRRSTRLQEATKDDDESKSDAMKKVAKAEEDPDVASDESDEEHDKQFEFDGKTYETYQDMVNAKRKHNEDYLKQNGLWKPVIQQQQQQKKEGNGLKRRKTTTAKAPPPAPQRKSSRLQGTPADGRFVEHEGGGSFVIAGDDATTKVGSSTTTVVASNNYPAKRGRANDGGPLSLQDAIQLCDIKWVEETSVQAAQTFTKETLLPWANDEPQTATTSAVSMAETLDQLQELSVDDDDQVAKVCPDRIYSVTTHPTKTKLVVAAGDKNGYVGLWNVDNNNNNSDARDGVHLMRPHTRPVNTLEWTAQGLLSSSYDGTVRYLDVAQECFQDMFSTDEKDDDNFYTQYLSLDPRANQEGQAFFLSTSMGSVMHVDRRQKKGSVTFHALCSDDGKKINSVSLHRDGHCLATGGLDRTVKFWDVRKFGSNNNKSTAKEYKAAFLGEHSNKLSVNSAFFSPSGEYLVTTNMANTLNIYHNAHLQVGAGSKKKSATRILQPEHVIRHNNNTGRWLTTFMAQWHPEVDIFCVGSMEKPRAMDVFGASGEHLRAIQGEALTAVASRCCFHPSTDKLILVGGNSSGRVTVIR